MASNEYPALLNETYEVGEQIGEGGMGAVFRCRDLATDQACAVKFLARDLCESDAARRRFNHEARILAKLRHPNIVAIHAHGIEAGFPYLVMDLCVDQEGNPLTLGKLQRRAEDRRIEAEALLALLAPMLASVGYLHAQGLVHRDLKPDNFLLQPDEQGRLVPKLSDFGLITLTSDDELRARFQGSVSLSIQSGDNKTRAMVGTWDYMSPEQREGGSLDARSDVYSVGLIMYRLATGYTRVTREFPSEVNPELPEWFDAMLETAMAREPGKRFPTAELMYAELPAELRQAYGGPDVASLRRRTRLVTRRSLVYLAALVILCALVLIAARRPLPTPDADAPEETVAFPPPPGPEEAVAAPDPVPDEPGDAAKPENAQAAPEPTPPGPDEAAEPADPTAVVPVTVPAVVGPQLGQTWNVAGLSLELAPIPAGSFTMGSPATEDGREDDEPQRQVTLTKAFWLGKCEVRQKDFEAIEGKNPSRFKGADLPVETLTWDEAAAFCRKLNDRERQAGRLPVGYEYRLPTEAEWEYACRAGTQGQHALGADADSLEDGAWYSGNSEGKTHAVGSKAPNAWGLHDMHGNVSEWCADWWGEYPPGELTDPVGAQVGPQRVHRGGSGANRPSACRAANRFSYSPGKVSNSLGFRVALAAVLPADQAGAGLLAGAAPLKSLLGKGLIPVRDASYAPLGGLAPGSREAQERQRELAAKAGLPLEVKTRRSGIVFRLVPPGSFVMGDTDSRAIRLGSRSSVRHRVVLTKALYVGKYEITQGQWYEVMRHNPALISTNLAKSRKAVKDAPVDNVSWHDCQAFLRKLCVFDGVPVGVFVLPTEAEWEYACRAGTQTTYFFGDEADELDNYAWYHGNSKQKTHKVGLKKPNSWGLHDMHGNVSEWCADWTGLYPEGQVTDPVGPGSGTSRVCRSGSWTYDANACRAARSDGQSPTNRRDYLGLRVVLAPLREWSKPAPARPTTNTQARRDMPPRGTQVALTIPEYDLALLPVKPGSFVMGTHANVRHRDGDETQHGVALTKAFWLGKYEVTQAQYQAIMKKNPSRFKGDDLPVDSVSWNDAMAFCQRLTQTEKARGRMPDGYVYRLPTEAEWEYACGKWQVSLKYFDKQVGAHVWYSKNSRSRSHAVGQKNRNLMGFHDMLGNVWEWCLDYYGDYPEGIATDPLGPAKGFERVYRGGGWSDSGTVCRPTNRVKKSPTAALSILGFRVALAPDVQLGSSGSARAGPAPASPRPGAPAPVNLLKNPKADDSTVGWTASGSATVENGPGGSPCFVVRQSGSFTQTVKFGRTEIATDCYVLMIGRTSSERVGGLAGLPYLRGGVTGRGSNGVTLQGQQMRCAAQAKDEWAPSWGIAKVERGARSIGLRLAKTGKSGVPRDGSAARFDDLGLYLFSSRAEATAFVDNFKKTAQDAPTSSPPPPVGRWHAARGILVIRRDHRWEHTYRDYGPGTWEQRGRETVLYWRGKQVFATFDVITEGKMEDSKTKRTVTLLPPPREVPKGFSPVGQWRRGKVIWTLRQDNTGFAAERDIQNIRWKMEDQQITAIDGNRDTWIWEVIDADTMIGAGGQSRLTRLPPPRQPPEGFSPVGLWRADGAIWSLRRDNTGFATSKDIRGVRWRMENQQITAIEGHHDTWMWEVIDMDTLVSVGGEARVKRLPLPKRRLPKSYIPIGKWEAGKTVFTFDRAGTFAYTGGRPGSGKWRVDEDRLVLANPDGSSRILESTSATEMTDVASGTKFRRLQRP